MLGSLSFALFAAGGCGGASDYQPTEGHSGTTGHDGQGNALGDDPAAALKKLKSVQGRQRASGSPPGR